MRLRDSFGVSDGETVAIALLHDVLEDTSTGYGEVRREFGSRVADAVLLLTKPKLGRKRDRCVYQNALADAGEELQLVKLADYLDNMRTRKSRARCETTAKKARQFLRKLEKRRLAPRVRHAARIVAEEIAEILPEDCWATRVTASRLRGDPEDACRQLPDLTRDFLTELCFRSATAGHFPFAKATKGFVFAHESLNRAPWRFCASATIEGRLFASAAHARSSLGMIEMPPLRSSTAYFT